MGLKLFAIGRVIILIVVAVLMVNLSLLLKMMSLLLTVGKGLSDSGDASLSAFAC
jgi:hypothetical protein